MDLRATAPANLVYDLTSIVQPIDLAALFPQARPLEVELGCGDASFLADYARRHPERNFIGVERLLGRMRKLDRKGRRAGLTNLRGVQIESSYFLRYLLPPHSASALHVYFPDPWPKKRHHKNRLINESFPRLAQGALVAGGRGLFANRRCRLLCANDRGVWREQGVSADGNAVGTGGIAHGFRAGISRARHQHIARGLSNAGLNFKRQ